MIENVLIDCFPNYFGTLSPRNKSKNLLQIILDIMENLFAGCFVFSLSISKSCSICNYNHLGTIVLPYGEIWTVNREINCVRFLKGFCERYSILDTIEI